MLAVVENSRCAEWLRWIVLEQVSYLDLLRVRIAESKLESAFLLLIPLTLRLFHSFLGWDCLLLSSVHKAEPG